MLTETVWSIERTRMVIVRGIRGFMGNQNFLIKGNCIRFIKGCEELQVEAMIIIEKQLSNI